MGRDPQEVWVARVVGPHAPAIVSDLEIDIALVAAPQDVDLRGARIDGIFSEFADRLERMGLRMRDDVDGVPLVADPEGAGSRLRG